MMTNYLFISNSSNFKIDNNLINQINLILNSQIDQDVKCSKSDYCINNTTFKELEKKILEIHSLYV